MLTLELNGPRTERICATTERWLVPFVPIALVSVSGVADVLCTIVAILFLARVAIRRAWSWLDQPWFVVLLLLWIYLCVRSIWAIRPVESLGEAVIWLRYPVFALAVSQVDEERCGSQASCRGHRMVRAVSFRRRDIPGTASATI